MARTLPTLLVALLVVTAGCSVPLADDQTAETPTVTPVPVGDVPADDRDELAPGLGPDGVTDPERLVDAHEAVLDNASYTAHLSSRRDSEDASAPVSYDRVVRVEAPDRFRYVLTVETASGERRIERWRDGDTAVETVTENGSTTRRPLDSPTPPTLVSRSELLRVVRVVPSDVVDTREVNGTTVYDVVGQPRDLPPLSNVSYVATVTERGLVRSYEVSYGVERAAGGSAVVVRANVTDVGETTVEPPSGDG